MVSNISYFHPYLGKIPILTNIFQIGWNHQLEDDPSIFPKLQGLGQLGSCGSTAVGAQLPLHSHQCPEKALPMVRGFFRWGATCQEKGGGWNFLEFCWRSWVERIQCLLGANKGERCERVLGSSGKDRCNNGSSNNRHRHSQVRSLDSERNWWNSLDISKGLQTQVAWWQMTFVKSWVLLEYKTHADYQSAQESCVGFWMVLHTLELLQKSHQTKALHNCQCVLVGTSCW